jgi:hypothetical protein
VCLAALGTPYISGVAYSAFTTNRAPAAS